MLPVSAWLRRLWLSGTGLPVGPGGYCRASKNECKGGLTLASVSCPRPTCQRGLAKMQVKHDDDDDLVNQWHMIYLTDRAFFHNMFLHVPEKNCRRLS